MCVLHCQFVTVPSSVVCSPKNSNICSTIARNHSPHFSDISSSIPLKWITFRHFVSSCRCWCEFSVKRVNDRSSTKHCLFFSPCPAYSQVKSCPNIMFQDLKAVPHLLTYFVCFIRKGLELRSPGNVLWSSEPLRTLHRNQFAVSFSGSVLRKQLSCVQELFSLLNGFQIYKKCQFHLSLSRQPTMS